MPEGLQKIFLRPGPPLIWRSGSATEWHILEATLLVWNVQISEVRRINCDCSYITRETWENMPSIFFCRYFRNFRNFGCFVEGLSCPLICISLSLSLSLKGPCSPKRLCALVFLFWNDSFVKCSVLIGFHFWQALHDDTEKDCEGDQGCLPFDRKFWKFRMEGKW